MKGVGNNRNLKLKWLTREIEKFETGQLRTFFLKNFLMPRGNPPSGTPRRKKIFITVLLAAKENRYNFQFKKTWF